MFDGDCITPLQEPVAAALRYLCHFPEALVHDASLCLPTGERLFIAAETVRAIWPGDVR